MKCQKRESTNDFDSQKCFIFGCEIRTFPKTNGDYVFWTHTQNMLTIVCSYSFPVVCIYKPWPFQWNINRESISIHYAPSLFPFFQLFWRKFSTTFIKKTHTESIYIKNDEKKLIMRITSINHEIKSINKQTKKTIGCH